MSGWMVWSPSSTHTGFLRFSSPNRSSTFPGRQSGRVATESTAMSSRSTTRGKQLPQPLHWGVGVGVGLEIGDVAAATVFARHPGFGLLRFGPGWTGGRPGRSPQSPPPSRRCTPGRPGSHPGWAVMPPLRLSLYSFSPNCARQYSFSVCTVSLPFFSLLYHT